MFARIGEFIPKIEKKEELLKAIRNEVLPLMKKQPGFLEILPLFPENKAEKVIVVSLWTEKRSAERYEKELYPKVEGLLKPFVTAPVNFKHYHLETTLCQHFVESLTA